MKKHLLVIGFVAFSMLAFGCKHGAINNSQENLLDFAEATKLLDSAYDEVCSLLASNSRNISEENYNPDDYKTWNLRDRMEAESWIAIETEDYTEVEKIAKDYGIYDSLMKIAEKYNISECLKTYDAFKDSENARTITGIEFDSLKNGDIVLYRKIASDGSSSGSSSSGGNIFVNMVASGYYKHAGIIDREKVGGGVDCVLTASTSTLEHADSDHSFGTVGYETKSQWTSSDYHVAALRVKKASDSEAKQAVIKGHDFINKPYGPSGRDSDTDFYCSKVVFRCWKSQGYDLEYHTTFYLRGAFVTPYDLYRDEDTEFLFGDLPE